MSRKKRPDNGDAGEPGGEQPQVQIDAGPAPSAEELADELDRRSAEKIALFLDDQNLIDGYVSVFRKGGYGTGTGLNYVAKIPLSEFRETGIEGIADHYGGGEYQLRFQDNRGRWVGQTMIAIDPRRKGRLDAKPESVAPAGGDQTAAALIQAIEKLSPPENATTMLVKMLEMQQTQSNQFLATMQQANATMLQAVTGMVAALKPAGGEQKSGPDILTALKVLDTLKPKENPMSEVIKVLEFGKKMFEERSGGEDDGGWFEQLVRGLAPVLVAGMRGQQPASPGAWPPADVANPTGAPPQPGAPWPAALPAPGAQAQPAQAPQPAAAAEPATNNTQPAEPIPMNPTEHIKSMARAQLPQILFLAAKGADPADAAALVANPLILSDELFDALVNILKQDNWKGELFGPIASISLKANESWFDALRAAILEEAADEDGAGAS